MQSFRSSYYSEMPSTPLLRTVELPSVEHESPSRVSLAHDVGAFGTPHNHHHTFKSRPAIPTPMSPSSPSSSFRCSSSASRRKAMDQSHKYGQCLKQDQSSHHIPSSSSPSPSSSGAGHYLYSPVSQSSRCRSHSVSPSPSPVLAGGVEPYPHPNYPPYAPCTQYKQLPPLTPPYEHSPLP